uniref:BTB domain-containing protein n=1 Tax=Coccidioides posadasii RMSCC 3488 TaxID=454284 RepID=A0A0J6FHH1_COCPO|nr:hypothetical protein CPAG_06072 [Coccidioides posadasii RMSCC 3488]
MDFCVFAGFAETRERSLTSLLVALTQGPHLVLLCLFCVIGYLVPSQVKGFRNSLMMASRTNFHQYPSVFKDCLVQVIVGSQKTVYYIHPGVLLSSGSPVLKACVGDQWIKDGSSGAIDWTDFDEDTVECALSYLYIEDYDVRCQTVFGEPLQEEEEKDQPSGLPPKTIKTAVGSFTPLSNACDEHLGNIALVHAKVYCFAHQILFPKLENLALQCLTQLLLQCDTPTDLFFLRLTDAIRLTYDSTPTLKICDPARELLSQYVALKYTTLSEESLRMLITEGGGDFMIDLTCKLARRILISGTSTQSLEDHIDKLELSVCRLEQDAQEQACLLRRAEEEIREWESWN